MTRENVLIPFFSFQKMYLYPFSPFRKSPYTLFLLFRKCTYTLFLLFRFLGSEETRREGARVAYRENCPFWWERSLIYDAALSQWSAHVHDTTNVFNGRGSGDCGGGGGIGGEFGGAGG
jgi:hypothetical protein